MGYPKYEEDNRKLLEERRGTDRDKKIAIIENCIPYHVRYQLPESNLPVRKKVYFLGRRQIR